MCWARATASRAALRAPASRLRPLTPPLALSQGQWCCFAQAPSEVTFLSGRNRDFSIGHRHPQFGRLTSCQGRAGCQRDIMSLIGLLRLVRRHAGGEHDRQNGGQGVGLTLGNSGARSVTSCCRHSLANPVMRFSSGMAQAGRIAISSPMKSASSASSPGRPAGCVAKPSCELLELMLPRQRRKCPTRPFYIIVREAFIRGRVCILSPCKGHR